MTPVEFRDRWGSIFSLRSKHSFIHQFRDIVTGLISVYPTKPHYNPLTEKNINRYWKEPYFEALESIRTVAEKFNLTLTEIALRWVTHHSLLKREFGDSILIGASRLNHIEQVCVFSSDIGSNLLKQPVEPG